MNAYGKGLKRAPKNAGRMVAARAFVRCDAHPSQGGPHLSRGIHAGTYHGATLWTCTHRSRSGTVCGALGLELEPRIGPIDGLTAAQRWYNGNLAARWAEEGR